MAASIVRGAYTSIMQQMMKQGFDLAHLVDDPQVSNLAMVIPRPAGHILLHMVEERIKISQRSSESRFISLMLVVMSGLRGSQDLIGLAIGFRKARVVLIVEVQVQTELIGQRIQSPREIVDVREAAKLDRRGLNGRFRPHGHLHAGRVKRMMHDRWGLVKVMGVVVRIVRRMVLGVRRDDMVIVLMVAGHMLTVRIIDHMVLVPLSGMTAMMRRVSVPAVMMVLSEYRCRCKQRTNRQQGSCQSGLHGFLQVLWCVARRSIR